MSENKNDDGRDALSKGITDLTEAALGVGVALTRTVADATARGVKTTPAPDSGAVGEIIHYGIAIVRNLLGLVFSVAGTASEATRGGGRQPAAETAADRGPSGPAVHQGGTLRIPLSVENPGAEALTDLAFRCNDLKATGLGEGTPIDGKAFRFEPTLLDIAPRDFEKLTLYIDAARDAAPGHYLAALGVGGDAIELTVSFDVLAADDAS